VIFTVEERRGEERRGEEGNATLRTKYLSIFTVIYTLDN